MFKQKLFFGINKEWCKSCEENEKKTRKIKFVLYKTHFNIFDEKLNNTKNIKNVIFRITF